MITHQKGNLETMLSEIKFPPQIRIMFFGSLLIQMEEQKSMANKTLRSGEWGEPVSVSFDFREKNNLQWYNFKNYNASSPVSDEQRNSLLSPLGFTKENMFLENKAIFVKLQFTTNEIYVLFFKKDGSKNSLTI